MLEKLFGGPKKRVEPMTPVFSEGYKRDGRGELQFHGTGAQYRELAEMCTRCDNRLGRICEGMSKSLANQVEKGRTANLEVKVGSEATRHVNGFSEGSTNFTQRYTMTSEFQQTATCRPVYSESDLKVLRHNGLSE